MFLGELCETSTCAMTQILCTHKYVYPPLQIAKQSTAVEQVMRCQQSFCEGFSQFQVDSTVE